MIIKDGDCEHCEHFVKDAYGQWACEFDGECENMVREQTNEEWLRSATTDGLTAIFMQFMFDAEFKARFVNGNFITEFRKWLKEKHDDNMG